MVETAAVGKIDQINRAAEVYFRLNVFATDMRLQINYNRRFELRDTLLNFRRCMIELYYIVRFNKDFNKDAELKKRLVKWMNDDCCRPVSVKYCRYSLMLFDKFTERLAQIGFVER